MCVMHIISTVDFAIRVLRSCCVSCHASQFDSGGGSYDQQIGDTFLRPPVLVGTFTRIFNSYVSLPEGILVLEKLSWNLLEHHLFVDDQWVETHGSAMPENSDSSAI